VDHAKREPHVRLPDRVAGLGEDGQGRLEAGQGPLAVASELVQDAKVVQGPGLAGAVPDLDEQRPGLLEAGRGGVQAVLLVVEQAKAAKQVGLATGAAKPAGGGQAGLLGCRQSSK
jgi:hypothetical protein